MPSGAVSTEKPERRRRGRPPKSPTKSSSQQSSSNGSSTAIPQSTMEEAIAKHCSKELKVVLWRCDDQLQRCCRAASGTVGDPPSQFLTAVGTPVSEVLADTKRKRPESPCPSTPTGSQESPPGANGSALDGDIELFLSTSLEQDVPIALPPPDPPAVWKQDPSPPPRKDASPVISTRSTSKVPKDSPPPSTSAIKISPKSGNNLVVASVPRRQTRKTSKQKTIPQSANSPEAGSVPLTASPPPLCSKLPTKNNNYMAPSPIPEADEDEDCETSEEPPHGVIPEQGVAETPEIPLHNRPAPITSLPARCPPSPPSPLPRNEQPQNQRGCTVPYSEEPSNVISLQNASGSVSQPQEKPCQEEEMEQEPDFFCNFDNLKATAHPSFNRTVPRPAKTMWFACVMWDSKIHKELYAHDQVKYQLFTTPLIGKLLVDSLHNEGHSWPGLAQMDWKKPFLVLDIISDEERKCGSHRCIRVQEKWTVDTTCDKRTPAMWDLVIFPGCQNLANEMVRLHSSGVKTTIVLWGVDKEVYPGPWDGVKGELFLKPTNNQSDILSVLIFHHEELTRDRGRLIHGPFPESELWENFQDPDLGLRYLMQVYLDKTPSHLTLHAQKDYQRAGGSRLTSCVPEPIALFPLDDSSDEEDMEEGEAVYDGDSLVDSNEGTDRGSDDGSLFPGDIQDHEEEWDDLPFDVSSPNMSRSGSVTSHYTDTVNAAARGLTEYAEKLFQRPPVRAASVSVERADPGSVGAPRTVRAQTDAGDCRIPNGHAALSPIPSQPSSPLKKSGGGGGTIAEEERTTNQGGDHPPQEEGHDNEDREVDLPAPNSEDHFLLTQELPNGHSEMDEDEETYHSADGGESDEDIPDAPSSGVINWGKGAQSKRNQPPRNGTSHQNGPAPKSVTPRSSHRKAPPPEAPSDTEAPGIIWGRREQTGRRNPVNKQNCNGLGPETRVSSKRKLFNPDNLPNDDQERRVTTRAGKMKAILEDGAAKLPNGHGPSEQDQEGEECPESSEDYRFTALLEEL